MIDIRGWWFQQLEWIKAAARQIFSPKSGSDPESSARTLDDILKFITHMGDSKLLAKPGNYVSTYYYPEQHPEDTLTMVAKNLSFRMGLTWRIKLECNVSWQVSFHYLVICLDYTYYYVSNLRNALSFQFLTSMTIRCTAANLLKSLAHMSSKHCLRIRPWTTTATSSLRRTRFKGEIETRFSVDTPRDRRRK